MSNYIFSDIWTEDFKTKLSEDLQTIGGKYNSKFTKEMADAAVLGIEYYSSYLNMRHLIDNEELSWYQSWVENSVKKNSLKLINEMINWHNKGVIFNNAILGGTNDFLSAKTTTSATPYNDTENSPEPNTQSKTQRDYLLFDASTIKWAKFESIVNIVNDCIFICLTIF